MSAREERVRLPEQSDPSHRATVISQDRYVEMIDAMRRAEAKMLPVLEAFEDQVLVLKHDLNARAISSLKGTLETLETDIASLIIDMNRSIEEADLFIEQMQA